jgi:pimeloyl-ACP methyl ester carboxylesterase
MTAPASAATAWCYRGGRVAAAGAPGLLFLHGAANDHSVWNLQSRYFAHHGWNVAAPDLPGHGRSPGPALDSVTSMAEFGVALLDRLGVERAALVGHSMGSLVALEMAARLGERVTALALLGTAFPMSVSQSLLDAAQADSHEAFEMINVWSHASPCGAGPQPGMWVPGVTLRLMERSTPGLLHRDLLACREYAAGLERAALVRCPVLLMSGTRDQMTPPKAHAALAERFPGGCRRVLIPDCGHALMGEQPDRVLAGLLEFLPRQIGVY